jgi:hypothetical protein
MHGHIGHDCVETRIYERQRGGHICDKKRRSSQCFRHCLVDRLSGVIQANNAIPLLGQPHNVIAGAAAEIKEALHLMGV